MMQCSRCGTILPDQSAYCHGCGLPLNEAPQPASEPTVAVSPVLESVLPMANETPAFSAPPPMEASWAEFSRTPTQAGVAAGYPSMPVTPGGYPPMAAPGGYPPMPSSPGYPPMSTAPDGYTYPGNYPYMPGILPPPAMPAPQRRGLSLPTIMILVAVVVMVIFGGVFLAVNIAQSNNRAVSAQAQANANGTVDPTQLYQQVTSQNPGDEDTLQNGPLSSWSVYEKTLYGCDLKEDGLHVHIQDTGHYSSCSSGRGKFSNFAFQIDMKIVTGDGGGLFFRADTSGNLYYFHVYPNGHYHIYVVQNDKFGTELGSGTMISFASGFNQKNTLTIIAQGNKMYFYVNQKFLVQAQDSTYTTGYLGVLANDHNSPAEVIYTNMKLWHL